MCALTRQHSHPFFVEMTGFCVFISPAAFRNQSSLLACFFKNMLELLSNSVVQHASAGYYLWRDHLIVFGSGLQQALLYGELQQVLLLLPHAVSLFASERGVSRRGLEHARGNVSGSARRCGTKGKRCEGALTDSSGKEKRRVKIRGCFTPSFSETDHFPGLRTFRDFSEGFYFKVFQRVSSS